MNTRNFIILHHTASLATDGHPQFDAVKKYHIGLGWGDIGYQYFLERDGTVRQGRREDQVGAHCSQWMMNYRSIGVCMAGDFDHQLPSPMQITALRGLLTVIQNRNGIPNGRIKPHRFYARYKSCPGKLVTDAMLDDIIMKRPATHVVAGPKLPDIFPSHP